MINSILLAYHPSDSVTMEQIRTLLQNNDFTVRLFDLTQAHMQPDTSHDAVVALCSEEANNRILANLIAVVQSHEAKIVYVLVRDGITSALPDDAQGTNWVDIRDKRAVNASMKHLLAQLSATETSQPEHSLVPNPLVIIGIGLVVIILVMIAIVYAIAPALA